MLVELDKSADTPASTRLPLIVFIGVLAVAFPLLLWLGNYHWFFNDDFDFLATRSATDLGDLFRPHNEHWSTVPILIYRALYRIIGLHSYAPYQAVLVGLHLTAAALLRVIMRRAGVEAWTATAGASVFALLGAGHQNIVWAFQIGFVGSLVCGLAHLILADHDGPFDRRDALGLSVGAIGLLCSGVAVTMTAIVAAAVLARRGWRMALAHVAPLALLYVVWWFGYARNRYDGEGFDSSAADVARFVGQGLLGLFDGLGQVPGVGLLIATVLIVGFIFAWRAGAGRRRLIVPGVMLVGALMLLVISGAGRVAEYGPEFARRSRFVHLTAALTLPALAVAADALLRRMRILSPLLVALVVVVIAGNIDALVDERRFRSEVHDIDRALILGYANAEVSPTVPAQVNPFRSCRATSASVGWSAGWPRGASRGACRWIAPLAPERISSRYPSSEVHHHVCRAPA
ncbi:MAG: hypothetical protein ACRDWD_05505 [Acidimicrobiia bacterium]